MDRLPRADRGTALSEVLAPADNSRARMNRRAAVLLEEAKVDRRCLLTDVLVRDRHRKMVVYATRWPSREPSRNTAQMPGSVPANSFHYRQSLPKSRFHQVDDLCRCYSTGLWQVFPYFARVIFKQIGLGRPAASTNPIRVSAPDSCLSNAIEPIAASINLHESGCSHYCQGRRE